MNIENDYLLSFWKREQQKRGCAIPIDMLKTLLNKYPYKFPFEGKNVIQWSIFKIESCEQLGDLWMGHNGDWLEKHGLWPQNNWDHSHRLSDLAFVAIKTKAFERHDMESCGRNYNNRSIYPLKNQNRPLITAYPYFYEITDGFGRLLPYLVLIYENKLEFQPFEVYLAKEEKYNELVKISAISKMKATAIAIHIFNFQETEYELTCENKFGNSCSMKNKITGDVVNCYDFLKKLEKNQEFEKFEELQNICNRFEKQFQLTE